MASRSKGSQRKRRSNRRNSLLSTGPRTREGKAKVRGNAIKHGLSVSISNSPEYQAELEYLTQALMTEAGDLKRIDHANAAAESQLETARVRQRRAELIDLAAIDFYAYSPNKTPPSFAESLKSGTLHGIVDHEYRLPFPREWDFELRAFLRAKTMLKSLERYEDRALARRNRALRQLVG